MEKLTPVTVGGLEASGFDWPISGDNLARRRAEIVDWPEVYDWAEIKNIEAEAAKSLEASRGAA